MKTNGTNVAAVRESVTSETCQALMNSQEFLKAFELYQQFISTPMGPLKEFWNSYIEMVGLLLRFIRATREGDWQLHLECVRELIPWMFAYDHANYSRYLPVYYCQMMSLEKTHPDAAKHLAMGEFAVQRN